MPKSKPLPPYVPFAERRRRSLAVLIAFGAPLDGDNLRRLAEKYETSYRRWRKSSATSRRPVAPQHLRGALDTARVFYSLAREYGAR